MKILFCTSRFPFPITKGDRLRAYYQILELVASGHEVHLLALTEDKEHLSALRTFEEKLAGITLIPHSKIRIATSLLTGIFAQAPFQACYFFSPAYREKLADLVRIFRPDVVFVQLLRLGLNVPHFPGPPPADDPLWFLDYMDSFSAGMEKRHTIGPWYEKPLSALEASRLRNFEVQIANSFNGFSIISMADLSHFPPAIASRMLVLPNGIHESFFNFPARPPKYDLIFTGNMAYPPNVAAARYLVQEILPVLGREMKVCLAGTDPVADVRRLESANVTVTGFVPDIRECLAESTIFVAPLFSGSGLQNKLLEAMAMGLPVVTSSLCNSALGAPCPDAIRIAETPTEFAAQIIELFQNPGPAAQMAAVGREFVRAHFSWPAFSRRLVDHLEKLRSES